ncbi:hypothetical protein, partial [Victivallis lenta]
GPSGREVNAALKLRWAQVEGQRINYMSRHNPRASLAHGPVDIKIKNKYTREQNGVTYYFYEFSMATTFGENKDREAEIDSGYNIARSSNPALSPEERQLGAEQTAITLKEIIEYEEQAPQLRRLIDG